jgi:hypothetical protein
MFPSWILFTEKSSSSLPANSTTAICSPSVFVYYKKEIKKNDLHCITLFYPFLKSLKSLSLSLSLSPMENGLSEDLSDSTQLPESDNDQRVYFVPYRSLSLNYFIWYFEGSTFYKSRPKQRCLLPFNLISLFFLILNQSTSKLKRE